MKISKLWLNDYFRHDLDDETLSKALTDCGLEVEGLELRPSVKGGLEGVIIGKVLTCENHPDSDHLHLCTVDVGSEAVLPIVCGASNVAAGQYVAVATIGTKLYNGDESFVIKKSKMRGHVSEGMICAEDELGLGDGHDGILVLDPEKARVGMPAAEYFGVELDTTIEIGLTPNRGDATSHRGVARDLYAVLKAKDATQAAFEIPSVEAFVTSSEQAPIRIVLEEPLDCPRYSGLCLRNVRVAPSPAWLQRRLTAVGIRPINNVVDITNYILMDLGQPLHAFDMQRIQGNTVVIRKAHEGERFTTLDGVQRQLKGSELMICDQDKPMCMAGVYGGAESGVTEHSTDVFLESAYFHPVSIRKSSKLHGLKTDASFRYERGADPHITVYALKRAALMMQDLCGAQVCGQIQDLYPREIAAHSVELDLDYMDRFIGRDIPREQTRIILKALDIAIVEDRGNSLLLAVPPLKSDVTRPVDIIEEILRIYGYNRLEPKAQSLISFSCQSKPNAEAVYQMIADQLSANGFFEVMNNSFTKAENTDRVSGFDSNVSVNVANPLSTELNVMRQSLLFGLLSSVAYNINRNQTNLKFYEFGTVYTQPEAHRYQERKHLGVIMTGARQVVSWENAQNDCQWSHLKAIVERVLQRLRLSVSSVQKEIPSYFHEGLSYTIKGKPCIHLGQLKTETLQAFDIDQAVFFAEFEWDTIVKALDRKAVVYQEVPKFPEVRRDLALLLDQSIEFGQIESIARACEKKLLKKVDLFDVYEGEHLPAGKKSYAVSFILQDPDKTLGEKQITQAMDHIVRQLTETLGAQLR